MKLLKHLFTSFLLLLLFTGCSTVSFVEKSPKKNTATIYAYVDTTSNINENMYDPCYKLKINDDSLEDCMNINEFMELTNLKPQAINIYAIRDDIDKKNIKLDLLGGKTYFLKIQSYSQIMGQYEFKQVSRELALKSIVNMKMANPPKKPEKEDNSILDIFSSDTNSTTVENKNTTIISSKTDEINKAYEMKEKGIITDEEFDKLKAEILAK